VIEEGAPGWQQIHSAGRAHEERRADFVFERSDLPADRRLRDSQAARGAPDVSFFGYGYEVLDLREAHG
jgi:hypothetical protein